MRVLFIARCGKWKKNVLAPHNGFYISVKLPGYGLHETRPTSNNTSKWIVPLERRGNHVPDAFTHHP